VERVFGVLKVQFPIFATPSYSFSRQVLSLIACACNFLYNMIIEDEYGGS
jgi:hypothetical protein